MIAGELEIHETLNTKLWDENNYLRPEIREKVIAIVDTFIKSFSIPIDVIDIHIVGSNASYNYTKYSDLDIHVVTNFEMLDAPIELVKALYDKEKASFNKTYDISIRGIHVELYVENLSEMTLSNGIYSIHNNEWIKFPEKLKPTLKIDINKDFKDWQATIKNIIANGNSNDIKTVINQIYLLRKNSLAVDGEYGKFNQIFKALRNEGLIDELREKLTTVLSKELSLESLKNINEYFSPGEIINLYQE